MITNSKKFFKSRNIFRPCFRTMWRNMSSAGRKLAENNIINNNLRKAACSGIRSQYGQPSVPRRTLVTYEQLKKIREEGYDILVMNSGKRKDSHINGHYALYEQATDSTFPYTHAKQSDGTDENPVVCCGDLLNNKAYTEEKAFLQRLGKKTLFRCVKANWVFLSRIDYDQVMITIKMRRIMRDDPEAFYDFQKYYRRKIHDNKNLDWEEKNNWAQFFFESFIEWQEVKNKK